MMDGWGFRIQDVRACLGHIRREVPRRLGEDHLLAKMVVECWNLVGSKENPVFPITFSLLVMNSVDREIAFCTKKLVDKNNNM